MLELPSRSAAHEAGSARRLDNSRIVVTVGANWAVQSATRVVFTLDYLGLGDRTSLLNGGTAAWKRAGKPTTTEATPAVRGTLGARATKNVVVDAEFVKSIAQRPNHKLVDARAAVFYKGIEPTMTAKRPVWRRQHPVFAGRQRRHDQSRARRDAVSRRGHQGGRFDRGVLSHRPAGDGGRLRGPFARVSCRVVRRLVPGLGDERARPRREIAREAMRETKPYLDPYLAGAGIGLVLLSAYVLVGRGLGASGAFSSVVASGTALVLGTAQAVASPAAAPYLAAGSPVRSATGSCSSSWA